LSIGFIKANNIYVHTRERDDYHLAPLLGEHTQEVLKEAGYSKEQIEALQADKVIG